MQISTYLSRYSLISIFKHKITENLQYIFFSPFYACNQLVKFHGDICKLNFLSYSLAVSRLNFQSNPYQFVRPRVTNYIWKKIDSTFIEEYEEKINANYVGPASKPSPVW